MRDADSLLRDADSLLREAHQLLARHLPSPQSEPLYAEIADHLSSQHDPASDISPLKAPRHGDKPLDLDTLTNIAAAAGHGHGHRSFAQSQRTRLWFDLRDNARPSYDVRFVQTFNPEVTRHLLDRLRAAEDTLAEHGLSAPDPIEHRIALVRGRATA